MRIQLNTDDKVEGREELARRVEAAVVAALGRFAGEVTRVEVHLGDESAARSGPADKRCLMEARPANRRPVAVTHRAGTLEEAYAGAAQKLKAALGSDFGRLREAKGAPSVRGGAWG